MVIKLTSKNFKSKSKSAIMVEKNATIKVLKRRKKIVVADIDFRIKKARSFSKKQLKAFGRK